MTQENKLKELKEVIVEANPDLLSCDVAHCQEGHLPLGAHEDGEIEWGACPTCVVGGVYSPPEKPIQLADVLIAIEKIAPDMLLVHESSELDLCNDRIYNLDLVNRDLTALLFLWEFKETLDNQPMSCIGFLHSLLIKK